MYSIRPLLLAGHSIYVILTHRQVRGAEIAPGNRVAVSAS
jgi:hypothetical protein